MNLVNVIVQQNTAPGGVDDDQQMLLDIEQNIANLEKSLQKGACQPFCQSKYY